MRQREKNFFCKTRFAFAAFDRSKAEYYLNAGIGGKPAVNRNGDAGDKSRRVIIQQEIQRAEQVLWFAEPAHRRMVKNFFGACSGIPLLVKKKPPVLIGDKEARRHCIDADTIFRKMHRKPLCKIDDCRFRAGIGGNLGERPVGVHGRNI